MNRTTPRYAPHSLLGCLASLVCCSSEHVRSRQAAGSIMQKPLHKVRLINLWLLVVACIGVSFGPALATDLKPGTHTGTLQKAAYRIDIPTHWNGNLVMLMHGYQPVGTPQTTPMSAANETPIFLKQGYAVAQSEYASQGWAVGDAIVDNERLRQHFIRDLTLPAHT